MFILHDSQLNENKQKYFAVEKTCKNENIPLFFKCNVKMYLSHARQTKNGLHVYVVFSFAHFSCWKAFNMHIFDFIFFARFSTSSFSHGFFSFELGVTHFLWIVDINLQSAEWGGLTGLQRYFDPGI